MPVSDPHLCRVCHGKRAPGTSQTPKHRSCPAADARLGLHAEHQGFCCLGSAAPLAPSLPTREWWHGWDPVSLLMRAPFSGLSKMTSNPKQTPAADSCRKPDFMAPHQEAEALLGAPQLPPYRPASDGEDRSAVPALGPSWGTLCPEPLWLRTIAKAAIW